ncbi:5-formyltetrahydrofolate cyclo-ligase, mitochondrial [Tanacetum coccineum]
MGWWSYKGGRVKGLVTMIVSLSHHHLRSTIASSPHSHSLSFTRPLILRRPQPSSYTPHRFTASATMTTINNLEHIFTQKKVLRSKVKKDLRLMDPTLRSHQDDAIQNLILEAPWFNSCKGLCAYISCSALREVDTSKVLRHILNNPTKVLIVALVCSSGRSAITLSKSVRFFPKRWKIRFRCISFWPSSEGFISSICTTSGQGYASDWAPPLDEVIELSARTTIKSISLLPHVRGLQWGMSLGILDRELVLRFIKKALAIWNLTFLICSHLIILIYNSSSYYSFVNKDGETETTKRLYVPRVEDKNCHMRMLNISGMDDLIANSMNILEPAPVDANGNDREDVMLANEPVDLLLLPGLAFDKTGRRLGRGGG